MTDIYAIQFDPNVLSHQQEKLGLEYSDNDTALDLMKKEEKLIISELTLHYSQNIKYKNTSELNAHIFLIKELRISTLDMLMFLSRGIDLKLDTKPLKLSERT